MVVYLLVGLRLNWTSIYVFGVGGIFRGSFFWALKFRAILLTGD